MKQRKDCFFGIHFDFHANDKSGVIGENFNYEVMDKLFKEVKPDFVQCDTKGHPGLSSYPTKVANPAKEIEGDPMRNWRELTKINDVALYCHYSGLFDQEVIKQNPSWGVKYLDGNYSKDFVCMSSKYDQEILIPQFQELIRDYQVDGLWVDGECWGAHYDVNEYVVNRYKNEIGGDYLSLTKDEQLEYLRECFRNHVRNYVKAGKEANPNSSICSNWAYSSQVPEEPTTNVDYISCDLYPTNAIEGSRLETRICQSHDLPWDIMSWGFSYPIHHQKSAAQLCQEAAFIISFGGGYQVYEEEAPSCSMKDPFAIEKIKEISKFCHDREQYVHHNKPICDVALIYSTKNYYYNNNKMDRLFGDMGPHNIECKGLIDVISENQIASEILLTYKAIKNDLSKYNLLVLSNCQVLEDDLKDKLLEYASNGGNLLLTGVDTLELFKNDLNIKVTNKEDDMHFKLITDKYEVELAGAYSHVISSDCKKEMYYGESNVDLKTCTQNPPPTIYFEKKIPSYLEIKYGKGTIKVITFNIGTIYYTQKGYQLRDFFNECVSNIERKVEVKGSHLVDVNINYKDGFEYIHLMNYSGPHEAPFVKNYDEIPSLYNLEVTYKTDKKVSSVTLLPENKKVEFVKKGNRIKFIVDRLDIYQIIRIEE